MTTVNVRYIVDDVEAAVAFYTTRLGFTLLSKTLAAAAERPDELSWPSDAGWSPARAGRLEPYSPRRR